MRTSFSLLVLVAMGTALMANPNYADPTPASPPKFRLAFITNNPSDYWTVARKGVEKAEKELGIKVDFRVPAGGTTGEQTQIVRDLLAKGEDGIAISPVDPQNQTELINFAATKALVFTQDTDAPKSKRSCFIGCDNRASGRQAGEELKRALPNGGEIMAFVGLATSQNATERIKGLKESLVGSKITLLGVRSDYADRAAAKANVLNALSKHPKLAACVGIWSYNGPAILGALYDEGKTSKVKIVCFDEESETLTGIKHGQISATIVQQPFEFGYQSIITMEKYLSGDRSVIPSSHRVNIPTLVVRHDNVDAFKQELDQRRGVKQLQGAS